MRHKQEFTPGLIRLALTSPLLACCLLVHEPSFASECDGLSVPGGELIWCDSFEDSDLPPSGSVADNYFDFNSDEGDQIRVSTEAQDGSYSLRQRFQAGETGAGSFMRTFGRSPVNSQSHSQRDFREIYWRFYVKYPAGTTAFPNKLTRAMVFSSSGWAQAMIGHVWLERTGGRYLAIDPASGTTTAGTLATTKWNDFNGLRWLGLRTASDPVVAGQWQCVEAHIALNSAGHSDGKFELWLDGIPQASRSDLNWVGSYSDYGINAVMLSNYWNDGGAPVALDRFIDSLVIATARIGCDTAVAPSPVTDLRVN